jgi:hypothetical protein
MQPNGTIKYVRTINFKTKGNKQQDRKTITNAIKFRINQEIKFLYKKKTTSQPATVPISTGMRTPI